MYDDKVLNVWTNWIPLKDGLPNDEHAGFTKVNGDKFHMGGCYLYAYDPTDEILVETPDHLDERVIYIGTAGSSTSRGIRSRTADFFGTIKKGYQQKNPYANGLLFRGKYNADIEHLYVAYFPMGYGEQVKLLAHRKEGEMLREYRDEYKQLPSCDGAIPNVLNIKELINVCHPKEMAEVASYVNSFVKTTTYQLLSR